MPEGVCSTVVGRCGLVSWLECLFLNVGAEGLEDARGVSCPALTDLIGDVFLDERGLMMLFVSLLLLVALLLLLLLWVLAKGDCRSGNGAEATAE